MHLCFKSICCIFALRGSNVFKYNSYLLHSHEATSSNGLDGLIEWKPYPQQQQNHFFYTARLTLRIIKSQLLSCSSHPYFEAIFRRLWCRWPEWTNKFLLWYTLHFLSSRCLKITTKCLIEHCERSELRLHYEWTKINQKWQNGPFWRLIEKFSIKNQTCQFW